MIWPQAPSIAEHPDLQFRELGVSDRYRVVRSPLLISATLYVPDLVRSEFDMLQPTTVPIAFLPGHGAIMPAKPAR